MFEVDQHAVVKKSFSLARLAPHLSLEPADGRARPRSCPSCTRGGAPLLPDSCLRYVDSLDAGKKGTPLDRFIPSMSRELELRICRNALSDVNEFVYGNEPTITDVIESHRAMADMAGVLRTTKCDVIMAFNYLFDGLGSSEYRNLAIAIVDVYGRLEAEGETEEEAVIIEDHISSMGLDTQ